MTACYTREEVAAMLGVSVSWVHKHTRPYGGVPCIREGHIIRYPKTMIDDWLADRTQAPVEAAPTSGRRLPVNDANPLGLARIGI